MAPSPLKANVRVHVDENNRFFAQCHPMFEKELRKLLKDIADRARVLVKQRHEKPPAHPGMRRPTGALRRSIQPYKGRAAVIRRTGPETISGTVTAGSSRAPYARYVHEGTRAHRISARPGKMLSFIGAGKNGRKTFKVTRLAEWNDDDWTAAEQAWQGTSMYSAAGDRLREEYNKAIFRHNRRIRDREAGRKSHLRAHDPDVKSVTSERNYANRKVVVPSVQHPGNKKSNFLNVAAHQVTTARYGRGAFTMAPSRGGGGRKLASRG